MLTVLARPTIAPTAPERMGNAPEITQGTTAQRLAVALRRHVGRGRPHTIAEIAAAGDVSVSAVEKAMAGEYTFGLAALLRVMAILPPQFANDLLELAGLTGARKMTPAEVDARRVQTDAARFVADISQKFEDGCLDHAERADLRQKLPGLIAELQSFHQQLGGE